MRRGQLLSRSSVLDFGGLSVGEIVNQESLAKVQQIVLHCAQLSHLPSPPIASQSISRDVPVTQARAFRSSSSLVKGVAEAALYCAHRASTFLLRALRARRVPGDSSSPCAFVFLM